MEILQGITGLIVLALACWYMDYLISFILAILFTAIIILASLATGALVWRMIGACI